MISAQLVQAEAAGSAVKDDLGQILQAAGQAAELTNQLLAFSRKQVQSLQILNVNTIVRDTAKLLRRLIGEHIALRLDTVSDLWPMKADRGQIEQVLINLAVNA